MPQATRFILVKVEISHPKGMSLTDIDQAAREASVEVRTHLPGTGINDAEVVNHAEYRPKEVD